MKKKVLFIIHSIHGGGAQKQMQYIIRNIDRNRIIPVLCIFKMTGSESKVIPEDIELFNLNTKLHPATFFLTIKLILLLIKIKPDRILSFMWSANIVSLLASIFINVKVVVSERIYTPLSIKKYSFSEIRKRIIRILYKRAERIIAVSNDVKVGLIEEFGINKEKIQVIYNGVDEEKIKKDASGYDVSIDDYLLACGTLEKKKNYIFLIEALSGFENITLVILGKGTEKDTLTRIAEEKGINLILPGYLENPYPFFKNARCLVLTSEYEGLPNVIIESMVLGTPVIAVGCPGGITEIIDHNMSGIIVPQGDKQALKDAVTKLTDNIGYTDLLRRNAKEKSRNFSLSKMINNYENIIS